MHDTINGTVKWFNPTKGFGFIEPEDGGQDVFVHQKQLDKCGIETLLENQDVSFFKQKRHGEDKLFATNISLQRAEANGNV